VLAACAAPGAPVGAPPSTVVPVGTPSPVEAPPAPAPRLPPLALDLSAGTTVEGRPIPVAVRGRGPDVCLVIATIHGDEDAGTPLADALLARLDADPGLLAGRRVVVIRETNPDGRRAGTRTNARGVDLNRNFEAPNRRDGARYGEAALSEPEARAIEAVVRRYAPSRVLSIHQPLACVDWDGPGRDVARAVAEAAGLPLRKLGVRPGSFGAWCEARGLALVTLELPAQVEDEDRALGALLAFVTHAPR